MYPCHRHVLTYKNKKAFQKDAYRPLAPTVYASPISTRCHLRDWVDPQVNTFEEVSSLWLSDGGGGDWNWAGPVQWSCEVQCGISNGHMRTPHVDRQTDTCKNITFLQLCWRAVKNSEPWSRVYLSSTSLFLYAIYRDLPWGVWHNTMLWVLTFVSSYSGISGDLFCLFDSSGNITFMFINISGVVDLVQPWPDTTKCGCSNTLLAYIIKWKSSMHEVCLT